VGGSVLELRVHDGDHATTRVALRGLGDRGGTTGGPAGPVIVPAPDGPRTLMEALRRLESAGVVPEDVALRKPTLDDVFQALTGPRPAPAGRSAGDAR
jgi:ABC-2 type transport system ATP-binding protein